jgi:beta-galactosidase/beta-glucuronidase
MEKQSKTQSKIVVVKRDICATRSMTKGELLEYYANCKAPVHFVQIDAFTVPQPDRVVPSDKDGDWFQNSNTWKLASGEFDVRILITDTAQVGAIVRVLRKIAKRIEDAPSTLIERYAHTEEYLDEVFANEDDAMHSDPELLF